MAEGKSTRAHSQFGSPSPSACADVLACFKQVRALAVVKKRKGMEGICGAGARAEKRMMEVEVTGYCGSGVDVACAIPRQSHAGSSVVELID